MQQKEYGFGNQSREERLVLLFLGWETSGTLTRPHFPAPCTEGDNDILLQGLLEDLVK